MNSSIFKNAILLVNLLMGVAIKGFAAENSVTDNSLSENSLSENSVTDSYGNGVEQPSLCANGMEPYSNIDMFSSKDTLIHDTLLIDQSGHLSPYDRRVMNYRKHWDVLMPTSGVIQVCGNMGIVSLGIGWAYGKRRQWETQILLGYVPKFDSDDEKWTLTLKENFIPWHKPMGKGWTFEPLECSLYFNTVFGHDFWTKQPTKYESGYYPFSTRIRPNLAFGERFKYDIPHNKRKRIKSITFFYELGTNDIYAVRFFRNGNAGFWDVFGLSFGAKVQYL